MDALPTTVSSPEPPKKKIILKKKTVIPTDLSKMSAVKEEVVDATKKAKTDNNITREEAESSATEWLGPNPSLMRDCLVGAIMDKKQHRDIGKILANASEIHISKWLTEKSGRNVKRVTGVSWDGITDDDKPEVRVQFKFRMGEWHFETTRRNSKKNENTNSTGHVAYSKDEFDMVAIFEPSSSFGITGSTIRCIPVSALINPSKPEQLVTRIGAPIRKIYDNDTKTDEVIKMIFQTLPLPLD
jgi:hypothetical protein